jgi:hypothetical protein
MADPFADPADVAGIWRPLSAAELEVAENLITQASAMIRAAYPGIDSAVTSGALDADLPRFVTAQMVKAAMVGGGEGVKSETVGPYARTYDNALGNLFLSAAQRLMLGLAPAVTGRAGSFRYA